MKVKKIEYQSSPSALPAEGVASAPINDMGNPMPLFLRCFGDESNVEGPYLSSIKEYNVLPR